MHHLPSIAVCVCTYKRPLGLERLLAALENQDTRGCFTLSVSIADNDALESGRDVVESWRARSSIPCSYCVVPEQNLAAARNASVRQAGGDFVAFIDDDEVPGRDWLWLLHRTLVGQTVDGVLGPVRPEFEGIPPRWVTKSRFFDRPEYATGYIIRDWRRETRTGNALVARRACDCCEGPFDTRLCSGGEDQDFFRRAMAAGNAFAWCNEAAVYETVPIVRTSVSFQIRRALLGGKASFAISRNRIRDVAKSVAALCAYAALLPLTLACGRHVLLTSLIKSANHLGTVLAALGIDVTREKYVLQ